MTSSSTNMNILGDYIIKHTIGKGTFSKVKLGIHKTTHMKVAIKILEKCKIEEKEDLERIIREMEIITTLNHKNVIKVIDMCETQDHFLIIMEYCDGGELFDHIVNKQRLSENESAFFLYQIINGVEYIHSKGIVHRDLKPENLLLDNNKHLKIIDFGLSNFFDGEEYLSTPCGSPCYASPEMVGGNDYNGFYIDVWSIGIIIFAMVCGYLPFEDKDNDVLFDKILACKLEYPRHVGKVVKDLMKRILVTDPQKRIKLKEIKQHEFYQLGKRLYLKKFGTVIDDKYSNSSNNECSRSSNNNNSSSGDNNKHSRSNSIDKSKTITREKPEQKPSSLLKITKRIQSPNKLAVTSMNPVTTIGNTTLMNNNLFRDYFENSKKNNKQHNIHPTMYNNTNNTNNKIYIINNNNKLTTQTPNQTINHPSYTQANTSSAINSDILEYKSKRISFRNNNNVVAINKTKQNHNNNYTTINNPFKLTLNTQHDEQQPNVVLLPKPINKKHQPYQIRNFTLAKGKDVHSTNYNDVNNGKSPHVSFVSNFNLYQERMKSTRHPVIVNNGVDKGRLPVIRIVDSKSKSKRRNEDGNIGGNKVVRLKTDVNITIRNDEKEKERAYTNSVERKAVFMHKKIKTLRLNELFRASGRNNNKVNIINTMNNINVKYNTKNIKARQLTQQQDTSYKHHHYYNNNSNTTYNNNNNNMKIMTYKNFL